MLAKIGGHRGFLTGGSPPSDPIGLSDPSKMSLKHLFCFRSSGCGIRLCVSTVLRHFGKQPGMPVVRGWLQASCALRGARLADPLNHNHQEPTPYYAWPDGWENILKPPREEALHCSKTCQNADSLASTSNSHPRQPKFSQKATKRRSKRWIFG